MILESWAGALGQPRGMIRGRRKEEGSGWGTHVYLWQIHFDIWQNQYNIAKLKKKVRCTSTLQAKEYTCGLFLLTNQIWSVGWKFIGFVLR